MSWLDKSKGKGGRPDGGDKPQGLDRGVGGTVVRPDIKPAPTIAKPGVRFQPNHEVTVDLQIKSLLGRGGMGEVYLARQRQWDVDVALKIPNDEILSDPENRHRIIGEAEAWTDLGLHPNIAYSYYAQPLGELLLLVIEYVDGGNLRQWIAAGRCADLKTGLDLAIQFCHGLEHAHKKLVHRDIKPENILLMQDGTLKITDFGIVRKAHADPGILESTGAVRRAAARMTTAGIGTPAYMAPEQWGDQGKIDSRADIFAFGVCLYEMLCGARPYIGDYATAGPRQEAPVPARLRGKALPERLNRLMKRCVDWSRDTRPSSAQEVRVELCLVYQEQFGEPCPHAELPELTTQADDCNNRALSYLALGRSEDAEKAWDTALEADPQHPESTYNYGLHRWRGAKATDQEVVASMRGVAESDPTSWLPRYLLAQIYAERGDAEGAKEELAKVPGDDASRPEVAAARRAVERLPAPTRLVRAFQDTAQRVCLTADGRHALSLKAWSGTLMLWEVESGRSLRTFRIQGEQRFSPKPEVETEGHTAQALSVCLSADGRRALSGSEDKTLKLWDMDSGRCMCTFEGHTDYVESVCLSADGRRALSGSRDKTLKLWDMDSGRCLRTFEGHTDHVESVCLSADGRHALSGSADSTLKLWDLNSGRCLATFEGHIIGVTSVCLSEDRRFALSASSGSMKLWRRESGQCVRNFEVRAGFVNSVSLCAGGHYGLMGCSDKTLKLWDLDSGRCLRTLEGHTHYVESVTVRADGRFVLSSGGNTILWEIGTFQHRAPFRLGQLTRSAESFAATARYAAALSDAKRASDRGNALEARRCLRRARREPGHRRAPSAVLEWEKLSAKLGRSGLNDCWLRRKSHDIRFKCLSEDGRYMLSESSLVDMQSGRRKLILADVEGGSTRVILDPNNRRDIYCLSADGRLALSTGLKLWDADTGRCLHPIDKGPPKWGYAKLHQGDERSVCLSADGRFALMGMKRGGLELWHVELARVLRSFKGHSNSVNSVCLSGDGQFALSGSADSKLMLWDVKSGRCLRSFEGHAGFVSSVCLSANGRYVLSGSNDKTLKLWELESGLCTRTFEGHTHDVNSVCLSADGRYVLSGSADKTAKLWEVESGRCLRTLGHDSDINAVVLTADGRYAVSVCDGTVAVWSLDWDLEENEPADWNEGARPYLDLFLRSHQPYAAKLPMEREPTDDEVTRALTRVGTPSWNHEDWLGLLRTLQCAGYGWLRPEGVGRELELMRARWGIPHTPTPAEYVNTASVSANKVGRNDPCPCGSGEKYKKCHGA